MCGALSFSQAENRERKKISPTCVKISVPVYVYAFAPCLLFQRQKYVGVRSPMIWTLLIPDWSRFARRRYTSVRSDFFDSRISGAATHENFHPDALPRFPEVSDGQDQKDRKSQLILPPPDEDDLSVRTCVET